MIWFISAKVLHISFSSKLNFRNTRFQTILRIIKGFSLFRPLIPESPSEGDRNSGSSKLLLHPSLIACRAFAGVLKVGDHGSRNQPLADILLIGLGRLTTNCSESREAF